VNEELLEQIVKSAPKDLGAVIPDTPLMFIEFTGVSEGDDRCYLDFADSDVLNGSAIVAMLDAMEKAGYECDLTVNISIGITERYKACVATEEQSWRGCYRALTGATRAEAVAKAFVAVFAQEGE
jgi:hypothetical protein